MNIEMEIAVIRETVIKLEKKLVELSKDQQFMINNNSRRLKMLESKILDHEKVLPPTINCGD